MAITNKNIRKNKEEKAYSRLYHGLLELFLDIEAYDNIYDKETKICLLDEATNQIIFELRESNETK